MKELLKRIRKIEIRTKKLVDGLIAGNYRSVFKGNGIEFSEIREYVPGDDVRSIDWKVTARFGRPFVKEFVEERDLRIYFLFDFSASGSFGNLEEKRQKAIEIAASLMFSAVRNNDSVGLMIFTDSVEKFIPARKGRKHVLMMIRELLSFQPKSRGTNLEEALKFYSRVVKKRSTLFILSDFYSPDFIKPLKIIKLKTDIIAIKLKDPREEELPDIGLVELEDEETGEQILVDTSDANFRKAFSRLVRAHESSLEKKLKKYGVDTILVRTTEAFDKPLRAFFNRRKLEVR